MNSNLYRVIFNAARGLLMAVQETASGFCKGSRSGGMMRRPKADGQRAFTMLPMRGVAFAALCVFGMQPVFVQAQVVAAPTATPATKPAVGVTANGIPLVQITTPNAAGVSNNTYTQYNVGMQGLILNNSPSTVQTKLGGYVQGNPYLTTGSARVIVNQVVGGSPSQLLGYTEVAGQQAEVVIANPAGLYCNGCGFINTTRSVLTTGTPMFGGTGSLDAFHVTGGQIQIGAAGLNASNVDQVDLIARSVQVNGKIWAGRQLDVVTGANDVNHADLSAHALTPDANTPGVAIDVAQLGGMYAGKIVLVGTEAGVGVNSLGTIQAQAGDVQLSNAGKVTLAGSTSASGNVRIQAAGDVSNSGNTYAAQNLDVNSQGQVTNNGTLASLGNATVSGAGVVSTGALGAGVDSSGSVSGSGSLAVSASGAIGLTGQNLAGGSLTVTGSSLDLTGAQTVVKGSATLTATGAGGDTGNVTLTGSNSNIGDSLGVGAAGALTNDRAQTSAGQLTVTAAALSNRGGALVQTGAGKATLTATGDVDNTQGTIQTGGAASLTAANVTNAAGRIVSLNSDGLTLAASGQITNTAGTTADGATGGVIGGNGDVTVQGASLTNSGTVTAGQTLKATVTGALDNSNGTLGATTVTTGVGSLRNARGSIVSSKALTVTTGGNVDNTQGTMQAGGAASVTAANVTNAAGRIVSLNTDGLTLTASGQITNTAGTTAQGETGGVIGGNGDVDVHGASLTNNGTMTAGQALKATVAGALDNSNGTFSGAAVTANAGSLKNVHGAISGPTVSLTIPQLDNSGGTITTNQLTVSSTNLANHGGTLTQLGTGPMSLTVTNALDNSNGGLLQTNSQDLTLAPASLDNSGGTITHTGTGTLTIDAGNGTGSFKNVGGAMTSNGQVNISAGGVQNDSGAIVSGTAMTVTTGGDVDNTKGTLQAGGAASVTAANVTNAAGRIVSLNTDGLTVTASGQITNTAGTTAQGATGGVIGSNGNVTLGGSSLTNGGTVTAGQTLNANATGALDNSNGTLSGAAVTADASSLKNVHGTISGPTVSLTIPQLDNSGGTVTANQLTIGSTNLTNHGGTLTQLGTEPMSMTVSNTLDNSNGGVLQTNSQDLMLTPASLNNNGGTITHAGTGTLTINPGNGNGAVTNVSGKIVSNGKANLTAGVLTNTGGTIQSRGAMSAIIAGQIDNTSGLLHSDTSLTATSGAALTNSGGRINVGTSAGAADASVLNLSATSIDNTNGSIMDVGSGAMTLSGTNQIVNSNAAGAAGMGTIGGNGQVTLTTATLANTQGGQLSGASLQVNAGTLNNTGGQIGNVANANGDIGITTSGVVYNSTGTISAARNLSLTVSTLAGGGSYNAANNVTLNLRGDFSNAPGYQFNAGGNLTFNLPGTFTNGGNLVTFGNLAINAGNIGNWGSIVAGGLLRTSSATLMNTGSLIGGSVSLNAWQSISNLGTTALIGATDSAGILEVLAPDIENRDDTSATDTQATTAIYGLGRVVLAGGKDANGNYTNANLIRNQSALIQSGSDMLLAANLVTNTRRDMTATSTMSAVDPALLTKLGISMSGCTAIHMEACSGVEVGWVAVGDPNLIGGAFTQPPHGDQWNSGYQYTTYTGVAVANTITSTSPLSQILAGGNLDASSTGTFQNYWSQVAATGNIASPITLDQDSWKGQAAPQVQVTYSGEYHYNNYDDSEHNWQLPFGDAKFVTGRPGGYTQAAPADIRHYALPGAESTFTAGGTLSGTGVTINNTAGNAGVTPLNLVSGQSLSGTNAASANGSVTGGGGALSQRAFPRAVMIPGVPGGNAHLTPTGNTTTGNANLVAADPVLSKATAQPILTNLTVPQGGLFKQDTAPNPPYLVETNPAFTNLHQWLSSDYYFQQMGMDPSRIQMRLGDGFYEQHLVQSQIMSLTGKSVLTNYADTQTEFEALMASGATLAKSLNLGVGMGLSDEQVERLTSNVVLMQNEVVDGKTVLVPVVYLAQASQENMGNGPVIAATNIDLEHAQGITNSGTIRASNNLMLAGQGIDSTNGTLQSGARMTLTSMGDINLTSGTLKAGSLSLLTGGNLILDTSVNTLNQVSATGATRVTSTLGPVASISVDKDASISVGGNFDQKAASLSVGGNLTASVIGNWTLDSVQTGEHKVVLRANGISDTSLMQGVGSSVHVGGASTIGVGGDLTAKGATIDLGGGGTIEAAGNLSLLASTTTSTSHSSSVTTSSSRHSSDDIRLSDDVVQGTTLESGQNLILKSGKDMTITGSTVDVKTGTALLAAAGNVNIGAATETHSSDVYESGSHSGFGSKSSSVDHVVQTAQTADGSTITADSVGIVSGKDLTIQGSSVAAMNDVALQAKGNIDITAAQDTYQDSELHDLKHSGFTSASGGLGIGYGSSEQKDQYDANSVTQSQARSTVGSVAGNVSISSDSNVHIGGSDVIAGKASSDTTGKTGNITVQAQNITIDPGQDNEHSHDQQDAHSSGFSVAVTGTPVDTVRNMRQTTASGNGFQRWEGASNEVAATTLDAPSVSMSFSHSSSSSSNDLTSVTNAGSTIRGGGNVALIATGGARKDDKGNPIDGDITVTGSSITAGGIAALDANRNVLLQASTDQLQQNTQSSSSSSGFTLAGSGPGDAVRWVSGGPNSSGVGASPYNASRANSSGDSATTQQTASAVVGNSVVVKSHTGDIDVIGSGISGMQGVDMIASEGAINVSAGTDTSRNHQESSSRQIGDLGSNGTGTGFTVGVSNTHMAQDTAAQTQSTIRSQIVSGNGNVSLNAKQDLTVQGTDLSAGKDLTLMGQNVKLDAGTDATQSSMSQSASQFGVTTTVGGALGNAVATINQSMAAARHTDNKRLAKLDEAQAVLAAYEAYQAISSAAKDFSSGPSLVKVTASVGGGTSHGEAESSSVTNDGSTLKAGGNVTIVATGSGAKDADGKAADGDITARGTQITGQNVELNAARDINLLSAQDTTHQTSQNSSSGGSVGVAFTFGGQQNGFSVELAASGAKGRMNGDSATNRNTQVTASQTLSMTSGRDTNLRGAEVSGNTVDANVGRDLNIASPQDTNTYDSKQTSAGVQLSICVPPFCYGASGSGSVDEEAIKDNYKSVGRQSGIYAGTGGFDVQVGNHTQLDGGVIASKADTDKNTLSTQTLGFTDLQNTSEYSGTSFGFSASGGGGSKPPSSQGAAAAGATPSSQNTTGVVQTRSNGPGPTNSMGLGPSGFGAAGTSSSESGTTYAAVSPATITVRGDAGTGKDSTAGLSRDTTHANDGALANSFDAQKVGDDLAIQSQTVQVGMQVAGDVGNYLKSRADKNVDDANSRLDAAKKAGDADAEAQAQADLNSATLEQALWKDGGAARTGLHAIVGGLGAAMGGGNVLGAVSGTIAGDAASSAIGSALDDSLGGNILKNVVSGAAGALAGAVVGGASGAISGANGALGADLYNRQLHPDERKLIGDKAHQMALEQAKSPDDVAKIEAYWNNVLTLVADADVDSQAAQQLRSQLSQMQQAAQSSGNTQAYQQFVQALQTAQQAIQGMAGQTITSNGGPIVADDGVLKTFQATGSQFKDSSLFGTPGGTKLGLAIGETPASVGVGSQYYIAPNGPTNQQVNGFANDILQQIGTANGSVTPVYPLENVVLGSMAGGLTSGAIRAIVGQFVAGGTADVAATSIVDVPNAITSGGTANAATARGLAADLAVAQSKDPLIGTTLPGASAPVQVTADASIGGKTFFDVNQTARGAGFGGANQPTLISDLIAPGDPNGIYGAAHAEIGVIQQAYDAGLTKGQSMTVVVRGQSPCSYCSSDLIDMANAAGLNQLTVVDGATGAVRQWVRGTTTWDTIKPPQLLK